MSDSVPGSNGSLDTRDVVLSTEVTLNYVVQGDPLGKVLLLVHGYSDSWRAFADLLPRISSRYRVYAPTLRGHGDSTKPEKGYSQADFAADIVAFMDALDIEKATLVGHSMGAFVVHLAALTLGERAEALVLVAGAATASGKGLEAELEPFTTLEDPIDPAFVREFQAGTFARPVNPALLDSMVTESLKVPARVWRAAMASPLAEDHCTRLSSIQVPTLVVGGSEDGFVPPVEQKSLADSIPGAELKIYGGGHAPHFDQPERFAEDLHKFLDGALA